MLTDKKEVMSELVRIDFFPVWYRFSREKPWQGGPPQIRSTSPGL
jgi:hypothetical protein